MNISKKPAVAYSTITYRGLELHAPEHHNFAAVMQIVDRGFIEKHFVASFAERPEWVDGGFTPTSADWNLLCEIEPATQEDSLEQVRNLPELVSDVEAAQAAVLAVITQLGKDISFAAASGNSEQAFEAVFCPEHGAIQKAIDAIDNISDDLDDEDEDFELPPGVLGGVRINTDTGEVEVLGDLPPQLQALIQQIAAGVVRK